MSNIEARLSELGISYATDARVSSTLLESRAKLVVSPDSTQVADLLPLLHDEQLPYTPLGSGSNSLLTGIETAPLETVIVNMKNLRNVRVDDQTGSLVTEAGIKISTVSGLSAKHGLTGLEFARDIPGTTAGAIATDAGHPIHNYAKLFAMEEIDFSRFPKDIRAVLRSVEVVGADGEMRDMTVEDLQMGNRTSILVQPDNTWFMLRANFQLSQGDQTLIDKTREVVCLGRKDMRCKNRDLNPHSVGRTLGFSFVLNHSNYAGVSANQLIATAGSIPDKLMMEGMYHSKATPNIICNTGSGTADGYLRIADTIQEAVAKDHGIEMPLEVRVIN